MTFLEASHISLIQEYTCHNLSLGLLSFLKSPKNRIERARIEDWSNILSFSSNQDIFSDEPNLILIDLQDLQPTALLESLLGNNTNNFLFWSSTMRSWPAALQKIWISLGGKYEKLTLDEKSAISLVNQYLSVTNLEISKSQIYTLVASCTDYQELLDKMDIISLSDNKDQLLKWFSPEKNQELFTLPLRASNLANDVKLWLKLVKDDDIQLALSLLWTKSEKIGRKDFQELIQQTDLEIKTRAKIPTLTQFKKLMFQIAYA